MVVLAPGSGCPFASSKSFLDSVAGTVGSDADGPGGLVRPEAMTGPLPRP